MKNCKQFEFDIISSKKKNYTTIHFRLIFNREACTLTRSWVCSFRKFRSEWFLLENCENSNACENIKEIFETIERTMTVLKIEFFFFTMTF